MERLCKDCKHYVGIMCRALEGHPNPVTGRDFPKGTEMQAELMRATLCGWRDPKFWEPTWTKPPKT